MLIVDFNTLQTVYTLYLTQHVILYCADTLDFQDIMWVNTTLCQLITGFQNSSVQDLDTGSVRNQVSFGDTLIRIGNNDLAFLLGITNLGNTLDFCDNGKSFRFSCLKKLLDTGKTLCDITTGNTTGMECTHGQLCTGLTDGLGSNNTDSLTDLNGLTRSHVSAVALSADTIVALTA